MRQTEGPLVAEFVNYWDRKLVRRRMGVEVSSTTRRTATNAFTAGAAQVLGKIATFAWTLVAARLLSQQHFGAFSYLLATALLLSAIAEWGFDPVLLRRVSRSPDKASELFTHGLVCQAIIGVPMYLTVALVYLSRRSDSHMRIACVLVLSAVFIDIISDTCRSIAAARESQGTTSAALVIQRFVTAAGAVTTLAFGWEVVGLSAALLGGSVAGLALHLTAVHRLGVRIIPATLSVVSLKRFSKGTWLIGISTLANMALFRLDAVLLGVLRGEVEVGIYAASYRLLETVLFIVFALRSAVFPIMSGATDPKKVSSVVHDAMATMALFYIPFFVIIWVDAGPVLELLYGRPYGMSSAVSLQWLAGAPLLYAIAYLANSALQVMDRTLGMLCAALAAVGVNLLLNLLFIPKYGAAGAGAVTTISYGVQAAVSVAWMRRTPVRPRVLRAAAEPAVAGLVLMGALLVLPWPVYVEVPIAGLAFIVCWALLVRWSDPRQLALLSSLVGRPTSRGRPLRTGPRLSLQKPTRR